MATAEGGPFDPAQAAMEILIASLGGGGPDGQRPELTREQLLAVLLHQSLAAANLWGELNDQQLAVALYRAQQALAETWMMLGLDPLDTARAILRDHLARQN